MRDRLFEGFAGFALRHRRALTIVGVAWFAVSCAAYARFIDLPEIPLLTDRTALWLSGAWNATWWGFLHPAIERRMLALEREEGQPPAA